MQIELKLFGLSGLFVKPFGRMDLDSAVEFGTTVNDAIDDSRDVITELVIDMSGVSFLSSFGLKVILELYKKMQTQGSMKLINVPYHIVDSFKMVGFDKFLVIE
jgi:anti-anti-sigma factor